VGIALGAGPSSGLSTMLGLGERGAAPVAALELTERFEHVRFHLEGLPRIAGSVGDPQFFGRSWIAGGFLNATALIDLDARGRIRAGAGFQVINAERYVGSTAQTLAFRATSARYEVAATLPVAKGRFVELSFAALPNVRAVVHARDSFGSVFPDRTGAGAEVDYSAGYGWRGGVVRYVAGVRGVSYHTLNAGFGSPVDRLGAVAATFEVRLPIAR